MTKKLVLNDVFVAGAGLLRAGSIVDTLTADPAIVASLGSSGAPVTDYSDSMAPGVATFLKQRDDRGAGGAPDLVSALLFGGSLQVPVNAPDQVTHFYVSQANGRDSNDGTTPGKAFATLARLMTALKGFWAHAIVCHFGPGTYVANEFGSGVEAIGLTSKFCVYFWGDGNGGTEGNGFTVRASGTVAAGSTTTILQTSAIAATDFSDSFLSITSGAQNGARRTIWTSTVGTVEVGVALSGIPAIGDTFEIVEPNVRFQVATTSAGLRYSTVNMGILNVGRKTPIVTAIRQTLCAWINLALVADSSGGESDFILSGITQMYGVQMRGGNVFCSGTVNAGTTITLGAFPGGYTLFGGNNLDVLSGLLGTSPAGAIPLWEGWGIASTDSSTNVFACTNFDYGAIKGLTVNTFSCSAGQTAAIDGMRTRTRLNCISASRVASGVRLKHNGSTAVVVNGNASLALSSTTVIDATSVGVLCNTGSYLDASAAASITGASLSIDASAGGRASIGASTVLVGSTKISNGSVLNMQTAAVVAGTQAPAAYSAAGVGFSNGTCSITRLS